MKTLLLTVSFALVLSTPVLAQQRRAPDPRDLGGGRCEANVYNCADTPNPLPTATTVWVEEMTWMDVRDALAAGKTTVLIPTGGMEPNGPWLATGKHNYVLHTNCEAIARRLGDALCAPIIPFVPEGDIEPPSGHMRSPGTISTRQETFEAVLTDVAHSFRMHGFKKIIFFGDSGGNQGGQRAVADRLTERWGGNPVVAHVQEYYDYASVTRYMEEEHGVIWGEADNLHDDPIISLNMFIDDPSSIRWAERVEAGLATINGVSMADRVKNLELARALVAFRASHTVSAINAAIENGGTVPPPVRPQRAGGGGRGAAGGRGGRGQRPAPDPRTMGGGDCRQNTYNCSDTPNPLPETNTVWLGEMTWMDIRDALAAGKTTAIIATGGMEPNGPWLVTGKHNYVLDANCEAIARNLGNALCAPIVKWVPEGDIEPQSGHMRSPGTISLRQETFEALLTDIAHSLKVHGFENIIFIGDSGGNRSGMNNVAETLTAQWAGEAKAIHIPEYYRAPEGSRNVLRERGLVTDAMPDDGLHDGPGITLNMMASDPASVRWAERMETGQAIIDGFSLEDLERALMLGREISEARAARTADLIRERTR
ncbi:MAG: creatininase family protein [Gemmatimonadetes bacterium]|nr:creatininase family protein [Gemmatimonadota bacterium]